MNPPPPSPSLIASGFSPRVVMPDGAKGRPLLLGEGPGAKEDEAGYGFHEEAEAGGLLWRLLARVGLKRARFSVANVVWQRPKNNELYDDDGNPLAYTREAIDYWKPFLHQYIEEIQPPVIIGLGRTALEVLTGFTEIGTTRGYVHQARIETLRPDADERDFNDMWDRHDLNIPTTCTYHPSFLNRGQRYLSGVFLRDVLAGVELGEKGWHPPKLNVTPNPTPEQFEWFCRQYNPERHILTYDIENPQTRGVDEDVLEDELGKKEISYEIDRLSFCFESSIGGYSIPYQEPFVALAKQLLESARVCRGHNCRLHDRPRLVSHGFKFNGREEDTLELWRHLHRTLPASVAYIAPFYLSLSPWKHEAHTQPEWYSAMDAVVQHHIGEGIERDLRATGQWEMVQRHVVDILALTEQMSRNGLPYDKVKAKEFELELLEKQQQRIGKLQTLVPLSLKPVKQPQGLKKPPKEVQQVLDIEPLRVLVDVAVKNKKTGEFEQHTYVKRVFNVFSETEKGVLPERLTRWARLLPYNPASVPQKLALIHHFGHKAKTDRKTRGETTGDTTLKSLITKYIESTRPQDAVAVECYQLIRECQSIKTALGHVKGWKPDADGLLHATPGIWGDMFRISWRNPPLAATPSDKKDIQIAAGFRKSICVPDDQVLVEADWRGMEAVLVAHFAKDDDYMRLAKLGPHSYLASHVLNRPADLSWSNADLYHYFKEIKEGNPKVYDDCKHIVHGVSYGMSPFLAAELYELTKTRAKYLVDMFFSLFPRVKKWQQGVIQEAHEKCRLVNAWKYHMPIWDAYVWVQSRYERLRKLWVKFKTGPANRVWTKTEEKELLRLQNAARSQPMLGIPEAEEAAIRSLCYDLGDDAKAALAFYPRDSGAAMLKDALLTLENEHQLVSRGILRSSTHDAILGICKQSEVDSVGATLKEVMERPQERLGGLVIQVELATGGNWDKKAMRTFRPVREGVGV